MRKSSSNPASGHDLPPTNRNSSVDALYSSSNNLIFANARKIACRRDARTGAIDVEETAGKMGDFIKQLTAFDKTCETKRVGTKEPYLGAERAVDGFFKGLAKPITDAKVKLRARVTDYLRSRNAERQRRETEARAAQAEADRLAAEARKAAEIAQAKPIAWLRKRLGELADTELSAEATKTTDAAADQATAAIRLAAQASAMLKKQESTARRPLNSRGRARLWCGCRTPEFWDHKIWTGQTWTSKRFVFSCPSTHPKTPKPQNPKTPKPLFIYVVQYKINLIMQLIVINSIRFLEYRHFYSNYLD